jgi:hypothetical protein
MPRLYFCLSLGLLIGPTGIISVLGAAAPASTASTPRLAVLALQLSIAIE